MITAILNLPLKKEELESLAQEIKRKFATGGAVKEGVIEIQGEKIEAIQAFLKQKDLL